MKTKGSKLIGFILGSMMIDYLAGFYSGVTLTSMNTNSGDRYKAFVKKYLSSYNPDDLWKQVRSRLVHNYSVGGDYGFTHMEMDGKHFQKVLHQNNKILTVLNLENFLKDIETAAKLYLRDLKQNTNLQFRALQRRRSLGIMGYIKPV